MTVENVFNFYSSDSYQQVGNCLYPYHFPVKSAEDFKEMASHDHVCVLYKNSYIWPLRECLILFPVVGII